jgi:hypothetical protein
MGTIRLLGLTTVATALLTLLAPSSSPATVICQVNAYSCPSSTTYTGGTTISGALKSESTATLKTSTTTVTCKGSTVKAEAPGEGSLGTITALTLSSCTTKSGSSCTMTSEKLPYGVEYIFTENGNGLANLFGKEELNLFLNCTISGIPVKCNFHGTPKLNFEGGQPAVLAAVEAALTGTGSCEKGGGTLTATYRLSEPNEGEAFLSQRPAINTKLCKAIPNTVNNELQCPNGSGYAGEEIKGELASGVTEFKSPTEPTKVVTCNETAYEGKYKEDGGPAAVEGGIKNLTFTSNVGGTPGKPCSSSFAGSPAVKVKVENLPFSTSTVTYQKPANPQGIIFFWPGSAVEIKFEVMTNPVQTCKYESRGPLLGEWQNGAGTNSSLLNPLTGELRVTVGGAICPVDQKLTSTLTLRGAGGVFVYSSGP